jgi:hypothetical protein
MRFGLVVLFLLLISTAFAQTDRGTITGTISDPSGAIVPNASIEARNIETAQVYRGTSTGTGNYTLVQLPTGTYDLSVNVQGFKKYLRKGLALATAQVLRADIDLAVGSSAEEVTVTTEATLLKTESGEVAQNVTVGQLNNLPILGVGETSASAAGVRNPWALSLLVPGTQFAVGGFFGGTPNIVVNGAQANTASYRVEGMDAGNNGTLAVFTMEVQPSAEAIQEVAVQTSNFAAEFGSVGGGLFNATMKSGTNQYHGTLYDYNVNEDYNSRQPYTGLLNKARRNDYGGSFGGPVRIPKIYNGANKTFFFWNFEQYRESQVVSTTTVTVPTPAYRNGDFSQVITGAGNLPIKVAGATYADPLGRTILSGTIFDPASERPVVVNGQSVVVRDPFPGNAIPANRFDSVALNIQKLIPLPAGPNAATQIGNNYNSPQKSHRTTEIPSLKIDQTLGKGHLAFYWSTTTTANQYPIVGSPATPEGFPGPITTTIGNFDNSYTIRLNYDHTITPTLLGHVGVGYQNNKLYDDAPVTDFNPTTELGLKGPFINRNFPTLTISGVPTTATGGMSNMGPLFQTHQYVEKPSANLSLTWVRQSHTYKIGSEWRIEGNPQVSDAQPPWNNSGSYTFAAAATTQTSLQGLALSQGTGGFAYASFLLGQVTTFDLGVPAVYRFGKQQWALFVQDSWKVTRKLTLDYGLRWDYGTYPTETYGRIASFGAGVPNPSAGGHLGGVIYEATCKCRFARNYPYAVGPRIGVAYHLQPRTVLRGGVGLVHNVTNVAASTPLSYQDGGTPGFGESLFQLQSGVPGNIHPTFPNFSPGALPLPNTVGGPPTFLDQNAGRPARQIQWSLGVQREITRDLVLEASYVGNRGVWWNAGALAPNNSMSPPLLSSYGFSVGNLNDATLLQTQIGNLTAAQKTTLAAKGIGLPYATFPSNQTLLQSLLPYPQYSGNISPTSAPLGKTWYDSLQTTVTERFSHGLSMNGNFTWSKNLDLMSSPDIYNRNLGKNYSINDLPLQFRLSAQYTTAVHNGVLGKNRVLAAVFSDWGIGWYSQYQSAPILALPASAGANPISKWLGRGPGPAEVVSGQSLWSTNWTDLSGAHHTDAIDINCHCFDPTKNLVLNPAAWQNVPDGQWNPNLSTIRYFRGFRYPTENANISRNFRFKEGRINLNVRAEFTNVFNRTRLPQPSTLGFSANPTISGLTGLYTGGFGTVVPTGGTTGARSGVLIGRLQF